jgi:3,4-dihydroxy 2-butanone 4-phosphate synthase/GTP cyclohydrolase II
MENFNLNTIDEALADLKIGKCIIIIDDEDRENEGDFVCAAEKVTPEIINFMSKYGRGLICTPLDSSRAKELELNLMVNNGNALHGTNFLVSVDSKYETSTGISSYDRSKTILDLVNPKFGPSAFAKPGHVFPLLSVDGGVLRRAGHTEAVMDLLKIAKMQPVGVLCEIMNDDGSMARLPELLKISNEHGLKIVSVKALIHYRNRSERLINKEIDVSLSSVFGDFRLYLYRNKLDEKEHLALVKGEIDFHKPVLVRVHSECLTGDVFGSLRCDCGEQLHISLEMIEKNGSGILLYMRQEGRDIGLVNKLKAYKLQEEGLDTVEANEALGFHPDPRDYGIGAQILADLGVRKMKLITNNPKKRVGLESYGLEISELVPIEISPNSKNEKYLKTKRDKLGHLILMEKELGDKNIC